MDKRKHFSYKPRPAARYVKCNKVKLKSFFLVNGRTLFRAPRKEPPNQIKLHPLEIHLYSYMELRNRLSTFRTASIFKHFDFERDGLLTNSFKSSLSTAAYWVDFGYFV